MIVYICIYMSYSLFISERGLSHVLHYVKPIQKPQSPMSPPVRSDELNFNEPESYKVLRLNEFITKTCLFKYTEDFTTKK